MPVELDVSELEWVGTGCEPAMGAAGGRCGYPGCEVVVERFHGVFFELEGVLHGRRQLFCWRHLPILGRCLCHGARVSGRLSDDRSLVFGR